MFAIHTGISPLCRNCSSSPPCACNRRRRDDENAVHLLRTASSLLHRATDEGVQRQPAYHRELSGCLSPSDRLRSSGSEKIAACTDHAGLGCFLCVPLS